MRTASRIVAEVLDQLVAAEGRRSTLELDQLAEQLTLKKGAKPAFKVISRAVVYRHSRACRLRGDCPRDSKPGAS